jgi:hypothetical protein
MTHVPDEFLRLARAFHQDSTLDVANTREWIAAGLAHLDSRQKNVVKKFLTELLINYHDDAKLQAMWNATSADYFITGGQGTRAFLTMIRDSIG